jgi:hypothetical protein
MSRRSTVSALACALTFLVVGVSTGAAAPLSLLLPQSTAFSILGRSCGGIQEQAFATGFDAATGYPSGDVYIQTRCGGSGRGGGYHSTTYSAWVGVGWDFAGNVLSSGRLTAAPTVSATFSATDANGDKLYNTGTAAYLVVPAPGAPTGLSAAQVGDQFHLSWAAAPPNPAVITSSTLTATPVGSTAPILTATVSGSAASGLVGPLQPQTTYQITVASSTAGGSSPASAPITVASAAASVVPSAPTGLHAHWTAPGYPSDSLAASWAAASPGDSPVDQYQITINGSDGGGTFTQTVAGTTLAATFAVSDIPDWSIQVRAHNTAGWGPWSARSTLGGL